jgi:hypothetical protein
LKVKVKLGEGSMTLFQKTNGMKPKLDDNYPAGWVVMLVLSSSVIALAIGLPGIFYMRDWLVNGRVYSITAVYGTGAMVYKQHDPNTYWVLIALYGGICMAAISLGTVVPISTIKAYIKKLARRRKTQA